MSAQVYRERLEAGFWLPLLVAIACAGLLAGVVLGITTKTYYVTAVCAVVMLLLAAAYAFFRSLVFEITEGQIVFGFAAWRKRFPRSALVSCEPFELTWKNYKGIGIRPGRDGSVAYNTRLGSGVRMEFEGEKTPYAVSVDFPEKIRDILT